MRRTAMSSDSRPTLSRTPAPPLSRHRPRAERTRFLSLCRPASSPALPLRPLSRPLPALDSRACPVTPVCRVPHTSHA